MPEKDLRVECPCCHSRIVVDRASEKVVGFERAEDLGPPGSARTPRAAAWDAAAATVRERSKSAADKLDQALSREHTREHDLDALFDKLKDRSARPLGDE
jgi:uncharacterized protein with von Willebrand factor type A (vWA) domain